MATKCTLVGGTGLREEGYLNVDVIIKFKIDFIYVLGFSLYSFDRNGIGSHSHIDVLQIDCVDR